MEFQDVVARRRMVRNFDPDRPVDAAQLDRMLANALHAPSAGFSQGFEFLVLEAPADRARFWDAGFPPEEGGAPDPVADAFDAGLRRAPVLVLPLSDRDAYLDRYAEPDKGWEDRDEARWPVPYWHVDTGFASLLMLLTVVDEGLGACFFGIPPGAIGRVREAFGIPPRLVPIGALAIGHRAPDHPSPSLRRGRRAADAVVHRGRF